MAGFYISRKGLFRFPWLRKTGGQKPLTPAAVKGCQTQWPEQGHPSLRAKSRTVINQKQKVKFGAPGKLRKYWMAAVRKVRLRGKVACLLTEAPEQGRKVQGTAPRAVGMKSAGETPFPD